MDRMETILVVGFPALVDDASHGEVPKTTDRSYLPMCTPYSPYGPVSLDEIPGFNAG
jgi:hypothetical protein